VGFGPDSLAPVAAAMRRHADVLVLARRGYGARSAEIPAPTVAAHVEDLFEALDKAEVERAVLAGMSGGATVVLAAALDRPERVIAAVAHEPAVGSLAPQLRAQILAALEGGADGLVRFLAGEPTWSGLPGAVREWLAAHPRLIEADARAFARYEPDLPGGAADAAPPVGPLPLVCSVGERSGAARRLVADRLAALTGAPVVVVPGCGHLPQFDAPRAFAEAIVRCAMLVHTKETAT
jgi:pimeloyl-ACP methyl ester carboxylesterase